MLKQTSSSDNLPVSDDDKHCSRCFNSLISWRNIAFSILSHNALQMGARLYSRAGVIRGRYVHRLLVMTERADSSLAYIGAARRHGALLWLWRWQCGSRALRLTPARVVDVVLTCEQWHSQLCKTDNTPNARPSTTRMFKVADSSLSGWVIVLKSSRSRLVDTWRANHAAVVVTAVKEDSVYASDEILSSLITGVMFTACKMSRCDSSSGGALGQHSRFHDESPGGTIRCPSQFYFIIIKSYT